MKMTLEQYLDSLCKNCGEKTSLNKKGERLCEDIPMCEQRRHLGNRLVDLSADRIVFGRSPLLDLAIACLRSTLGLKKESING
jgi:hypothetical protein